MAGRPPAEKSFAAMLRIAIKEAGEDGRDNLRQIADTLVSEAIEGNMQAIKEVADRLDGKPAQQINHANATGEGPVKVEHATDAELAKVVALILAKAMKQQNAD